MGRLQLSENTSDGIYAINLESKIGVLKNLFE